MNREYWNAALFVTSGVLLVGFQFQIGWVLLLLSFVLTFFCTKKVQQSFFPLYSPLAILSIAHISTSTAFVDAFTMGSLLVLAVVLPYFISPQLRRMWSERKPNKWTLFHVSVIIGVALISYFLLPYYLVSSEAYLNWSVTPTAKGLFDLFIGTQLLGLWDELFFIMTVLTLFRRIFSFAAANLMQAILFCSFLFELGFTGWGPFITFPFALLQGYLFKRTDSLLFVVMLHLTLDLVLFLALVWAHYPGLFPYF